ncbi:antibiotic biosynthesis monooxygenase family protein [Polaromonas sp.]|uniref:putative quinol monooxygenase n=1 Tax=Polaromonas sp. TaxID=1869339 RepID=UPI003266632E
MQARIGTFEVSPEGLEEVVALFRDRVVPAFSAHTGFIGYQAYVDRAQGRFVGVSLWASREALDASGETALRARNDAADLGARTIGEPQILEMAFAAPFQP